MTLNLMVQPQDDLKPRITVFGVGGAGGNAVNNMIAKQLDGVEFVVANTDAQALQQSTAPAKVQMGVKVTEGLGAGARPSVGAAAAEESIEQIIDHLAGAHMCFITAGMGGGTGTGAAPIIAQAARELGVLTVGVVTKPFQFEGSKRMRQAEDGIDALQKMVDTLIIIPNQNLFRLANERTTFTEAFSMADDVLYQGVKGVTDLMVRPGLINLDFADVRAVMDEMGKAMMGTGESEGDNRAVEAAERAIANPLLDEISLRGAKGVLINITGGHDLTLFELDEAANRIREEVDPDANIIVGSTLDEMMEGRMRVSVVATGIDATVVEYDNPVPRRRMAEPLRSATGLDAAETPETQDRPAAAREIAAESPALRVASRDRDWDSDSDNNRDWNRDERPAQEASDVDLFATADEAFDELPPPAYRPQSPEFRPRADAVVSAPEAERRPAARSARPGTPTPEALARLQAAVQRRPGQGQPAHGQAGQGQPAQGQAGQGQGGQQRPAAQQAAGAARSLQGAADKPRFGINSLINRMTGHQGEGAPERPSHPGVRREQPQMTRHDDDDLSAEQQRIEIPAFLRRQAN